MPLEGNIYEYISKISILNIYIEQNPTLYSSTSIRFNWKTFV